MTVVQTNTPIAQVEAPEFLRNLRGWLVWRREQKPGEAKPRKVPYYTNGKPRAAHGSVEDRESLVTFEAARSFAARRNYDGVGFATLVDWGIVVLDFDGLTSQELKKEIEDLVAGTYAEWSPSGEGIHAFVRGWAPNKKSRAGDKWRFGFETFHETGYVTFTGNRLDSVDLVGDHLAPMNDGIKTLFEERFGQVRPREARKARERSGDRFSDEQITELLKAFDPSCDYDEWIRVGMAIHHETDGEGLELWDVWSADGSNYEGYDNCREHWDSFGRKTVNPVTINSLLKTAQGKGVSIGGRVASVDDFDDIPETPEETAAKVEKASRFAVIPADEFVTRPAPGWIIKGVLPLADIIMVFGESGSGKSFIVADMGLSIARGEPWRGLKTKAGRVAYIAAEGGGGFRNRLKAYAEYHDVDLKGLPFGVIHAAPNFLQKEDIKAVIAAIEASGGADVVVVDTFAQVTPGANENAGEDMGLALKNARAIGDAVGAAVILVHHSGKDASKGARGWSGLRAAADAELEVLRVEGTRWIRTTKQKDGDDEGQWGFKLEVVNIGVDEDDDVITSCVAIEAAPPEGGARGKLARAPGKWEVAILEALAELQVGGGRIQLADLIAASVAKREDLSDEDITVRNSNAKRSIKGLAAKGLFTIEDFLIIPKVD
jgi:hypothetical protein